jgi:hypothetical protein
MLLGATARQVLGRLRARPGRDVLADPYPAMAPLQEWALQRIDARFRLLPVTYGSGGFTVVRLAPRH